MSQRIVIDSLAFARQAGMLQGNLPIAGFSRVLDMLTDSAGELAYRVVGSLAGDGKAQVVVELSGVLSVCCQRCLEAIEYPVRVESVLEFVMSEDEITQEAMEDDSKDFLVAEKEFDVTALIEDELILALPPAPRHDSCALPAERPGRAEKKAEEPTKPSPFSALSGLKRKDS